MFLKSLTLKGFKSFAEATTMELEPGVTVVVGPNGSGKSNVVDAIAWVLGAQAPSSVRSQKMDDVIFAGTATRAPLGRAEVTLTLDNSAGILPIELSEVTIRRTLFRSGDSEYAINDVPCRLLDVQELLSDAGVGRQQHVIISQGQIDAVLNARPEERRAIVEEAAGVLKFRKRKEKAERRLEATEASLLRVQDLLREVRRQLRPLERQAEAARRHGDLIGELTALRIHVAGREVAGLRTKLTALATTKLDAAAKEQELKSTLARLDTDVAAASAELSARGADDVSDRLRLVEQLRERSRGVGAVIVERRRALQRDRGQLLDADVVASLEGDAARFAAELSAVRTDIDALDPEVLDLELAEEQFAAERKGVLSLFDPVPQASAASAIAEVRGELRSRKAALERAETEIARARRRAEELTRRGAELAAQVTGLHDDCRECDELGQPLGVDLERAEAALAVAEGAHADRVADRQRTAERASGLAARVEALQLALDAARARAGAERLAGVDGVLGTLLDLVRIDAGWESAVEAALGEALGAVVVADPDAAGRALHALRSSDTTGAVLALGLRSPVVAIAPVAGDRVRPHVTADLPGVATLLDRLLAGAICVGDLDEAAAIAGREPAAVVVTPAGDRFGASGWRIGAAGNGVTAAALADAEARAAEVAGLLAACEHEVTAAGERRAAAARAVAELAERRATNESRLAAATKALARAEADQRQTAAEHEPLQRRIDELTGHLRVEHERITELERLLPELEAGEAAEADAARSRQDARAEIDARAAVLTGRRRDLDVRAAGLAERAQFLQDRLDDTERRLAADAEARVAAEHRRVEVERSIAVLDRLGARVDGHRLVLDALARRPRRAAAPAERGGARPVDPPRPAAHRPDRGGTPARRGARAGPARRARRGRGAVAAGDGRRDDPQRPRRRARGGRGGAAARAARGCLSAGAGP